MKGIARLVIAMVLGVTGGSTAASSTNEWVGVSRVLGAASQWSPNSAPTNGANIRDWVIGGPLLNETNNTWLSAGDLVNNSATALRVYADTVYIQSGVNLIHTNNGSVFDLGFTVTGHADNRIVVKTGFDIASGVTNNVALRSTKWVSNNANNVITFNHNGSGILKIQNNWVETPGIALVYKGSAANKVEFGTTSTYTGGTTLDNVTASVITNISIGAASGSVVLTNGSSLNLATFVLTNKVIGAAGSAVNTVISGAKARTLAIQAQGDMILTNSSGTVVWNGAVTIDSGAQLDLANSVGAVTQLGGTLSGSGKLRTAPIGTTVLSPALDASGFSGEMIIRGVTQFKADNSFGSGGLSLTNAANLRGFVTATDNLDYSFNNSTAIQGNSRLALTTGPGLAGNNASVTAGGDITFTKDNATLSLEAGGNIDNYEAVNTLNINGVIKENTGVTGHVLVDNHWTTAYFTNSITKLSGANTYHGKTDVAFGRMQLVGDGSINNSSNLHVQAQGIFDVSARNGGAYTYGGTVDGTGLIVGDLTLTGNVNPGNSPGTLTFDGALTLADGSVTTMEITEVAHDVLRGNGVDTLTTDGTIIFDFGGGVTNGYTIALTDLFSNWGSVVTTGVTYSAQGLNVGQALDFSGGNLTVIPEPTISGMLMIGAVSVILFCRNKTRG